MTAYISWTTETNHSNRRRLLEPIATHVGRYSFLKDLRWFVTWPAGTHR